MNFTEHLIIENCFGFDWDVGNNDKNWLTHQVTQAECEQIFFNIPLLLSHDKKHSTKARRFYALGQTEHDRALFIVFTIRGTLIRIILARDMSKKERKIYDQVKKNS